MSNAKNLRHLPTAIDAIYQLARLDANTVEENIRAGLIHPGLTAKEARALAHKH